MKKMTLTAAAVMLSALLAFAMTGCTGSQTVTDSGSTVQITASQEDAGTASESSEAAAESVAEAQQSNTSAEASAVSFTGSSSGMIDTASLFTERDLAQTADLSAAETIAVSDGETVSITEAGVYVLTGSAAECTENQNVCLLCSGTGKHMNGSL